MDGCDLKLFPGFRFHPTDEELVKHYLCRRCAGLPIHVPIIADVDLYKYDPWQLPGMAVYGEKEWYFFSPRDRKYPNGSRPNRAAGSGYWKATGADKPLGSPKPVAIKKALVFYTGKAPRGEKTNWIMHEYRLADVDRSPSKKHGLRLDDWVLCRIYNKKGSAGKPAGPRIVRSPAVSVPDPKPPKVSDPGSLVDLMWFDGSSESAPRVPADSSCSEHVEVTCDREVQSRPRWGEMPIQAPSDPATWLPAMDNGELSPVFRDPLLHDVLMYLQKPF